MSKINEYNPDVLSCISNLSSDEVFTPPEIVNNMLDMLPKEIWQDKNATFLDPCCKTGVFLREIAKRLLIGLENQIPDLQERIDHIFHNQLFGIAVTELTSLLSRRSVYCSKYPNCKYSITSFDDIEGNIRYKRMEHTWYDGRCIYCGATKKEYNRDKSLENYAYEFIHNTKIERMYNMKFDVIIGNPPYQLSDGGAQASAQPIYHLFINQAKKLNPRYLCMIVPARWYAGGKGLEEFRKEMLRDRHIIRLVDYFNSSDCFKGVSIKGGVCYFLRDRDTESACTITTINGKEIVTQTRELLEDGCDVFIRWDKAVDIFHKVSKLKEKTFESLVSSRKPFGIDSNFSEYQTDDNDENAVDVYGNKCVKKVLLNKIPTGHEMVDKYKIFISRGYGAGEDFPHQIINKPIVCGKNSCCSETYVVVAPGDDLKIVNNIAAYMQTKFFRFMVLLCKNTQDATSKVYRFVPLQDFSKSWTDKELYNKYNLTAEEIDFIESMIKPMGANKED